MRSVVIHDSAADRDLRPLLERVPDLGIFESDDTPLQSVIAWAQVCDLARVFVLWDSCKLSDDFDIVDLNIEADLAQEGNCDALILGDNDCAVYFASSYAKVLRGEPLLRVRELPNA